MIPLNTESQPSKEPKDRSPGALKRRFPYMFRTPNYGLVFYRGWMPILTWACEEIDTVLGDDKRDFQWDQLKEKFGTGRFYYVIRSANTGIVDVSSPVQPLPVGVDPASPAPASVSATVRDIVRKAEAATATACMVCGATAQVANYGGYMANVCTAHQPSGPDDVAWRDVIYKASLGDDDE